MISKIPYSFSMLSLTANSFICNRRDELLIYFIVRKKAFTKALTQPSKVSMIKICSLWLKFIVTTGNCNYKKRK